MKRRRSPLPPDDPLFAAGDAAREAAAAQAAAAQPVAAAAAATAAAALPPSLTSTAHACATCGRHLASAALLDQHVAEAHDAFFEARAARGDAVFRCPLPGCAARPFASVTARAAHAANVHGVSRDAVAAMLGCKGGVGRYSRNAVAAEEKERDPAVDGLAADLLARVTFGRRRGRGLARR